MLVYEGWVGVGGGGVVEQHLVAANLVGGHAGRRLRAEGRSRRRGK